MADSTPPERPRWALGHDVAFDYHRGMLADPVRMTAYERALRQLISPGDVVLDLGAGSGILAMLAARRGARVHAVESMPVANIARALIAANHLDHLVSVHHADIHTLDPVEPVDLIVSDFMGRFLIDDGMLSAMATAQRWLKPSGRVCPHHVTLHVAPVGDFHLHAVDFFNTPCYGLDLSAAQPATLNTCYHAQLADKALMAEGQTFVRYTPGEPAPAFEHTLRFDVRRAGRLQGIVGWFSAAMAEGITLDTGPGHTTHWGQYLFPLPPTLAQARDQLTLHLWLDQTTVERIWHWHVILERDQTPVLDVTACSHQWAAWDALTNAPGGGDGIT